MKSASDPGYLHRVELVNIVLGGMTPSELNRYVKESKSTITSWVKTADEKGFEALQVKKQKGRPARLTAEQLSQLKDVLRASPQAYGYSVWDGPALSSYINQTYHVDIGVRQCQRMLRDLKPR